MALCECGYRQLQGPESSGTIHSGSVLCLQRFTAVLVRSTIYAFSTIFSLRYTAPVDWRAR